MSNLTEPQTNSITTGWESPSNIALIKYWGKYGNQLPRNASVSFTLSQAATRTFVTYTPDTGAGGLRVTFQFEGKENNAFKTRIEKFLHKIQDDFCTFLQSGHIFIESVNSFPHSSGIASSASAMSALSLCLCDISLQLSGKNNYDAAFFRKASLIARIGSGSACRSVFPQMAVWGINASLQDSSEEWAVPVGNNIHPVFRNFHDDILIISPKEKSVSSTAGHQLMENNPYASVRYAQANQRLNTLLIAINGGDVDTFGKITEAEALTLHALMMCSDPAYILMEEGSLAVIKKIQHYRNETGIPVYFTLDAGPNVHVLYPDQYEAEINHFITAELKPYCHEGKIIRDHVGPGPIKIM